MKPKGKPVKKATKKPAAKISKPAAPQAAQSASVPPPAALPTDWAGKTPTPEQWRQILERHAKWNRGEADGSRADLSGADLSGANLSRANLSGAYLSGANLKDVKDGELAIARTRILPEGQIIGWKKCMSNVIVKLSIPVEAKRSHAFGRKCRAEFADVLEVSGSVSATSMHDGRTTYRPGERVTCDRWNEDWTVECGGGIHFYLTRAEAEAHQ
jgi:hypothetical protein